MSDAEKSESQLELISFPHDLSELPATPLKIGAVATKLDSRTVGSEINALWSEEGDPSSLKIVPV